MVGDAFAFEHTGLALSSFPRSCSFDSGGQGIDSGFKPLDCRALTSFSSSPLSSACTRCIISPRLLRKVKERVFIGVITSAMMQQMKSLSPMSGLRALALMPCTSSTTACAGCRSSAVGARAMPYSVPREFENATIFTQYMYFSVCVVR
jgi:hypothetical protein